MKLRREVLYPVSDEDCAILLGGWGNHSPGGSAHEEVSLDLFSDAYLVAQWHRHAAYLRTVAARWQWRPRFYIDQPYDPATAYRFIVTEPRTTAARGPYFYSEALAVRAGD